MPHVSIKGYPQIVRAVISRQEPSEGSKGYNLLIEGYGMAQVMRTPGIDFTRTRTNHILETASVLGIEASR